jgi:hypothetical protein
MHTNSSYVLGRVGAAVAGVALMVGMACGFTAVMRRETLLAVE